MKIVWKDRLSLRILWVCHMLLSRSYMEEWRTHLFVLWIYSYFKNLYNNPSAYISWLYTKLGIHWTFSYISLPCAVPKSKYPQGYFFFSELCGLIPLEIKMALKYLLERKRSVKSIDYYDDLGRKKTPKSWTSCSISCLLGGNKSAIHTIIVKKMGKL